MGLKKSVLVIDDDEDFVKMLTARLERWGHRVTCANDALQAVIQAEGVRPRVIICDIQMPIFGTGINAYAQMRRSPTLKKVPILFLTGMPEEKARKIVPAGDPNVRLMFKPPDWDALKKTVSELYGPEPA